MLSIHTSILLHEKAAILYRVVGILLLYLRWLNTDGEKTGLFLLLLLSALMLLRQRFLQFKWTLIIDQLIVIGMSSLWENSSYALILSVFETMYLGCPFFALPALFFTTIYRPKKILSLLLIQGAFAGATLWGWRKQQESAFKRMDEERRRHYETESLKQELLNANVQIARMAELSERNRLAHQIHDNAGHEIVAAYMSLQAVQAMFENESEETQTRQLFYEGMERLETGIDKIREAVHNIAPLTEIGVESLKSICKKFSHCPVEFAVYGDSSGVSIHLWAILETCLKEALTNVLRHANAKRIKTTLDITPYIVRLCVENDGVIKNTGYGGIGLYSLRQRAMAVGGNISTDLSDCFRLVCVLPLDRKEI